MAQQGLRGRQLLHTLVLLKLPKMPLLGQFRQPGTDHVAVMPVNPDHGLIVNEPILLSWVWVIIHFSVVGIDIRYTILVRIG